jgi:hypothetical protein
MLVVYSGVLAKVAAGTVWGAVLIAALDREFAVGEWIAEVPVLPATQVHRLRPFAEWVRYADLQLPALGPDHRLLKSAPQISTRGEDAC